jgi:HPt (histidine-containing phosphotransfer) domain-containing protein
MTRDNGRAITDDARAWLRMLAEPEPGATEEARDLVQLFIEDGTTRVAGLQDAASRGDLDQVRWLAHELSGSSATFGAHLVAEICRQVIELADTADPDGVRRAVAAIPAAMGAAAAELADEFLGSERDVSSPSGE